MTNLSRIEVLSLMFAVTAALLLGTVGAPMAQLDAMIITRVPLHASSSSSVKSKLSALDRLKMARSKMEADKKALAELKSHMRLTPRFLHTSTGANILHGSADSSRPAVMLKRAGCGDGLVIDPEQCDDGNTVSGDGCSASCTVEHGFSCNKAQPSVCWGLCGDGAISSTEECDDGNNRAGDGCNDICKIEPGFSCSGEPSVCTPKQ